MYRVFGCTGFGLYRVWVYRVLAGAERCVYFFWQSFAVQLQRALGSRVYKEVLGLRGRSGLRCSELEGL